MKLACCKQALIESPSKQLIKFNCFLANLTRNNQYSENLNAFQQFHSAHRLRPDHYTISSTLTACANIQDAAFGGQLHAFAIRAGFTVFPHVANTLLFLYAKLGDLVSVKRVFGEIQNPDVYSWTTFLSACTKLGEVEYACRVFDELPERDVAVWNAMITGCAGNACDGIAFSLFREMQLLGLKHDNYTFASVLSLCSLDLLNFGRQVHSLVLKTGFLGRASVMNSLLTMYFNCESVTDAYVVFEDMVCEVADEVTYNAMIAGLAGVERVEEALLMFKDMQNVGLRPTELTFVSVMGVCSRSRFAIQVHAQAIMMGFQNCISVSNAAITMYSSCGDLNAAYMIFLRLTEKDVVTWNAMITSYAQHNLGVNVILAYLEMQRDGIEPDEFAIGSLLACSELLVAEAIQAVAIKKALILKVEVSNALLSALSRHGQINQANKMFHEICHKNLISWNTMISAFQLNGFPAEGLNKFSEMLLTGLRPNVYTLSLVLSICANVSDLKHGKQVHGYTLKFRQFGQTSLGNALVTLYAKCGYMDWSLRTFETMLEKDVISWNSLISAYAQHGRGKEAVSCFKLMEESSEIKPDKATFTAVLSACSHSGLVADGLRIFTSMVNDFGIEPEDHHFSCIVDLLGRAGYLDIAERLINDKEPNIGVNVLWNLFSSCVAHGNLKLGRLVAQILLETEQDVPTVYVLLSNLYANAGKWEESANVRALLEKHGAQKQPGSSWIT